jgi:hypothetical protein
MLRNTFLYQVFVKDKPLFYFFLVFIAAQAFFTYKHVENTPFFHYGMYSAIHKKQAAYTVYSISIDKRPIRSLDFPAEQRDMVYSTIALYDGLKQLGFRDSLDKVISKRLSGSHADYARSALLNTAQMDTPYQKWLFGYVADMRLVKTPVIEVSKQQVSYQPDGSLAAIDTPQTLFKLRYD